MEEHEPAVQEQSRGAGCRGGEGEHEREIRGCGAVCEWEAGEASFPERGRGFWRLDRGAGCWVDSGCTDLCGAGGED